MRHKKRSNKQQLTHKRQQILVQLPVYYIPTKPADLDQATGRTLRAFHNIRALNIFLGSAKPDTSLGILATSFGMVYDVIGHQLTLTYNGAGGYQPTKEIVYASLKDAAELAAFKNTGHHRPILLDLLERSVSYTDQAIIASFGAPVATYLMGLTSLLVTARDSPRVNEEWFNTLSIKVSAGKLQGILEETYREITGEMQPQMGDEHTTCAFLKYMEHARPDLTHANAQR